MSRMTHEQWATWNAPRAVNSSPSLLYLPTFISGQMQEGLLQEIGHLSEEILGLTRNSLVCVWQPSPWLLKHKSCRQAMQVSCSLCLQLSPTLPASSATSEDADFEVLAFATTPCISHKADPFSLAVKGYHSWKYWGRRTLGQWCYHRRRQVS